MSESTDSKRNMCECPRCKTLLFAEKGIACVTVSCPACGSYMVRVAKVDKKSDP